MCRQQGGQGSAEAQSPRNAVLAAYNITGTTEGFHDPKFARFPRAIFATLAASAVCGIVAILVAAL